MARIQSLARMGYFPLPEPDARRIRQHLVYPSGFAALDPCAGGTWSAPASRPFFAPGLRLILWC
jgi:hypothetical protein